MFEGQHAESKTPTVMRNVLSIVLTVAVIVVLALLLRSFVLQPYEIPSSSMEETILPGDMVFSEKVTSWFTEPQAGDIVTFEDPETLDADAADRRILIKRVIATEGQTVDLVDGKVVVDGVALDEDYTNGRPSYPLPVTADDADVTYPYTVGENELWVMGDNRTNSQDSRYFGAIDLSTVTGKAFLTYWPLNRFGLLG